MWARMLMVLFSTLALLAIVQPVSSPDARIKRVNAPILSGTDPASPADNNSPRVMGSAAGGTTVRLFGTSDCSGPPLATGTASAFASPGLTVSVGDNSTTSFRATSTDATKRTSPCSTNSVTYVENSGPPAGSVLRPDSVVTSDWTLGGGATSAWEALNDAVTQPTPVPAEQFIYESAPGSVTEVGLTNQQLGGVAPTDGKAWFYGNVAPGASVQVDVVWGGAVRASSTISGGSLGAPYAWRAISAVPPTQSAADDLRLRFTLSSGSSSGSNLFATYFELLTGSNPATPPNGATLAEDTASSQDPLPFWGSIDCESASRHQQVSVGGDPHPKANGAPQGNSSFRRLTALDGDDFYGERCELGRNDHRIGTTVFYHEGDRRVTYLSIRLPSNFPPSTPDWQKVMQMKQTHPSDNGGGTPVLSLGAYDGKWMLFNSDSAGPSGNDHAIWEAPVQTGVWIRFAFDIVYSQSASKGSIQVYVDTNGDNDFADASEQSSVIRTYTLKYETGTNTSDGLAAGQSIPSHLRAGIYHNSAIACPSPSGCSVDLDNVQVVAP